MSSKVSLYSPHDKQKLIHAACDLTDECFYVIAVAGRRAGKSMAALNQILYWSLKYPKCNILYITPTDEQGGKVIDDILSGEGIDSIIKSRKNSKGSRELVMINDSKISFKSSDSRSIRGMESNFVVVDEAAYLNNKVFNLDIMPTMANGGKKVLVISTPCGKNWFYDFYLKGLDSEKKEYKSFKFLSTDNPRADKKLIEMFKSEVSEAIFRQEYEASFEDSAAVFRNIFKVCVLEQILQPVPGDSYFAGCDIGLLVDETVLTIINQKGEVCFMDRFTGVEAPELRARLLRHLKIWKPIRTIIELNNQGLPLVQDLKRDWPSIEGFNTTNQSKEELINKLISAFSGEEIKCLNDDEVILQLNSFIHKMTSSGKIHYGAAFGHDDIIISLALAWSACVKNIKGGNYHVTALQTNMNENKLDDVAISENEIAIAMLNRMNKSNNRIFLLGANFGEQE
jgi:phage FluMu gp28-like protein